MSMWMRKRVRAYGRRMDVRCARSPRANPLEGRRVCVCVYSQQQALRMFEHGVHILYS